MPFLLLAACLAVVNRGCSQMQICDVSDPDNPACVGLLLTHLHSLRFMSRPDLVKNFRAQRRVPFSVLSKVAPKRLSIFKPLQE